MRFSLLPLAFGLATAAIQGNVHLVAEGGLLEERTFGLLEQIVGEITKGGLGGLEAKKIAFLCHLTEKADGITGFIGGLKLEDHWKKKLEFLLHTKCKGKTTQPPPPSTSTPPPASSSSPSLSTSSPPSPPSSSSASPPPPETSSPAPETSTTPPQTVTIPPQTSSVPSTGPLDSTSPPETTPPAQSTRPPVTKTITECIDVTTAIPPCATACFASAGSQVGCGDKDFGCFCKPDSQAQLSKLVGQCVLTACPPASVTAVITGASSVCACFTNPPKPTTTNVPPPACSNGSGGDCTPTQSVPEPSTGPPQSCAIGGDCNGTPPGATTTGVPTQEPPPPAASCTNGTGEGCPQPPFPTGTGVPPPGVSCTDGSGASCTGLPPPVVTAAASKFSIGLGEGLVGIAWLALAL